MNQQTDNMYIDDRYSDEALRKQEEIREHISWFREFLTFGTSLPEHIRRRYGLEEDRNISEGDTDWKKTTSGTRNWKYRFTGCLLNRIAGDMGRSNA